MAEDRTFASASLTRHLIRGVVGFGALVASIGLVSVYGPLSLLLAPVGLLALRGCPMCWIVGLIETLSMGRLKRTCVDGSCELTPASTDRAKPHIMPPSR